MEENNGQEIIHFQIDSSSRFNEQPLRGDHPIKKSSFTRPPSNLDHLKQRTIISPHGKRGSSELNDFPIDLNHSTSGVLSHDKIQIHHHGQKNVLLSQQNLKSSEAGMSSKNIQSFQNHSKKDLKDQSLNQKNYQQQTFDTRDPVQKYGSYLETKSSKFLFKDQFGRVARRDSRQSAKSQNSGNDFSFIDQPQGHIQINDKASQFSQNSKVKIKMDQVINFAEGNGQSPYFKNHGQPMAVQQFGNQGISTVQARTLSGQDTIEDNTDLDSNKIKIINNQDLNHLDIGQQNQNFIQHLQISSTSTLQQREIPQQALNSNQTRKQQIGKPREQLAVNVLLLDGNVPYDGRIQLTHDQQLPQNSSHFSASMQGSPTRAKENQKRQMALNQQQQLAQAQKQQAQKPQHKLNVVLQNSSIQQKPDNDEEPSSQTDNINFKNVHQSKKGQDSEIQSEFKQVENQTTRDIILLKQFNKQVITEQIQKQTNNTDIMRSFDGVDSAYIRNNDHLKFLGQTENIQLKANHEDDIILQPLSQTPIIQSNVDMSSKNPQRIDSDLSNPANTKDLENKDSSNIDSPYQKNQNMTPQNFVQHSNHITRVNTLLLNAPSDANLLGSAKKRVSGGQGSSKFIIQSSVNKSKRWLLTQQKQQNSELFVKEESRSSFQDQVLKGYNNESPNNHKNKQIEYFDMNLDQSSQKVSANKGSRNFQRKTLDERPTKYADLVRKFISRSPRYGRRNASKETEKSETAKYQSQGKIKSLVLSQNIIEQERRSSNNIKPKQVEKIIKNSYKPLDSSSQVQRMIQRSKDRNKSYFQKLQEQRRSGILRKSRTGSKNGRIEFGDIHSVDQAPQIIVQDQDFNYYRGDKGSKTASNFCKRPKLIQQQQSNRYRGTQPGTQNTQYTSHIFNPYNDPVSQQSPSSFHDQVYGQKPFSADASKYANLISTSQHISSNQTSQNLNRRISSKELQQITETGMSHLINELDSGVDLLSNQIEITKNKGQNMLVDSSKDGVSALTEYELQLSSGMLLKKSVVSSKDKFKKTNVGSPRISKQIRDKVSYLSGSKIAKNPLLGVMYQNVNRVLSIGDIDGVKGDPAENIREKGIFEQKVPFELQKSQIQGNECNSLKLMKLRRQCCYADGAIQYDKQNSQRDDKCLDDHRLQKTPLNNDEGSNEDDMVLMASKRNTLDQNSKNFQSSNGIQMFAQDGFFSRQSEELIVNGISSTPASQSIQKMKHLRKLKNKQSQYLKTQQTFKKKSTAALILDDVERYDVDRGQTDNQKNFNQETQFGQFQIPTHGSFGNQENQDQDQFIIEESIMETSRTKELLVAQTIDQGNQIFSPPQGAIKGDQLYQVRGYQSSLPQHDQTPSLYLNLNEKSDLSQDTNSKIDTKPTPDTNLERNSRQLTESNNSDTARLAKLVKQGNQIREMPTPQLETQVNYWKNQHKIHLQQIEQEKVSIFTPSQNFEFFQSPISQNNQFPQPQILEEEFTKLPGFSKTSYMGFKIPDFSQQQKMNKLRTLIKTANGPTNSSAKSINIDSLQKQTTKTSFNNMRRLRNKRGDHSQGSNIYSSFNRNSSQDLKMKHGTGSAVSFASRPSTNQGQQKTSSQKNLKKRESLEVKMRQIQKRSNLNFKKENASILKSQAEKDHDLYISKQIASITVMSSDALKASTTGGQNIVQQICQSSLRPIPVMNSQPSEVLPGSHISKENVKVNIGVSTSMSSFGNIHPKFKGSSVHQTSIRKVDEYNQDVSISYQPYEDGTNTKMNRYSVNTGDRTFKKIQLDNQGPPTEMNIGASTQTPQPQLNTTKLSERSTAKEKLTPKGTLVHSSLICSNKPVSEATSNIKIHDQQSTMMVVRQVTTDQEVQQIFIDVNQKNSHTGKNQQRPSTAEKEETVVTNENHPSMARRFSGAQALESQSSVQKAQTVLQNSPRKDEELKLTVEQSQESLQKNCEQVINQDLKQEGVETPGG